MSHVKKVHRRHGSRVFCYEDNTTPEEKMELSELTKKLFPDFYLDDDEKE